MIICASCGKNVKEVCSNCWRCWECEKECKKHMKRTINGVVGNNSKKENNTI